MNKEKCKKLLEENLKSLQQMEVKEILLYKKWLELNDLYKNNKNKSTNMFFDVKSNILSQKELYVKNNIWIQKSPEDYLNIEPEVIYADTKDKAKIWETIRMFCSTMLWKQSPGRLLKFYVIDKKTQKYLGVISLGSDFISVGGRDKYIGWTQDQKLNQGMLKHTAMGSSIVPTQPLGYNYLGGKLLSLLTCCDVVEKTWNKKYKENLVGITTTSLYGGYSQYNSLNYWRKCKSSEGKVTLEPTDEVYDVLKDWYRKNFPDKYNSIFEKTATGQPKSHIKFKILSGAAKELGVKLPENNAPRGVYFCSLYNNTLNFLSMKDKETGTKKFDNSVNALSELWKNKYANKRIDKLIKSNKISNESLFYDDMVGITWKEVRKKYYENT